jgi:hypothetical protein
VSVELLRFIDQASSLLAKLVGDHDAFIAKVLAASPDLI